MPRALANIAERGKEHLRAGVFRRRCQIFGDYLVAIEVSRRVERRTALGHDSFSRIAQAMVLARAISFDCVDLSPPVSKR
jgi:hypothetical protein